MVKPAFSKRKLFNGIQEHKENDPEQLTSTFIRSGQSNNQNLDDSSYSGVAKSTCDDKKIRSNAVSSSSLKETFEDVSNTHTPNRPVMPMSERQQIALLMQLSSPSPTSKTEPVLVSSPQTPQVHKTAKRNERGETSLHVAAIKGDSGKILQLLEEGASVNSTDYAGWTALHEACNRGFADIASYLIGAGADVNAKGLDDDTPLHDACVNNHIKIVRLLLKSGASVVSLNCRGKSPRDVCRSPSIFSLIEQANKADHRFDCVSSNIMSRRTPPSNKGEEKPSLPTSSSSVTSTTSTSSGASVTTTSSINSIAPSSNGNGRPTSPRMTFRLGQMGRIPPEKNQQRPQDKPTESEDVYEFRCSKEEATEDKKAEETAADETKQEAAASTTDSKAADKRGRENEQEEEDENKRKRRKEDTKEATTDKTTKTTSRSNSSNGSNPKPSQSTSTAPTSRTSPTATTTTTTSTAGGSVSTTVISTSTESRKSPMGGGQASSPKPSTPASAPVTKSPSSNSDSDGEEGKNDSNSGAPKVPPLKIVLAPASLSSEQETSTQNGSNRQLPYVVNSSSVEDKENNAEVKDSGVAKLDEESSPINITAIATSSGTTNSNVTSTTSSNDGNNISCATAIFNNGSSSSSSTSTEKGTRITRSQKGGSGSGEESVVVKQEVKIEEPMSTSMTSTITTTSTATASTTDVIYPRKRKIRAKEPEAESSTPTAPEQPPLQQQQQVTNCYEMFLRMRKQVERRRKLLFPVQPKPPEGFKNYLMNQRSYALANNSNSQLSVPLIPPPASLSQPLKDLFNEQEKERYKLRWQHQIEQTKLVLSVEQEILRVHGRAARALASQVLPFSVCTILKDEEVYNVITLEQEEKDRNLRSRYNGRHFFSWLQEVDDKWEKIKEAMVLRHHNEAESLHAVQKMDWEWKLKELSLVDSNSRPQIEDLHVPMVQVSDDFDLPA